jgi:hypothetical protein
MSIVPLLSAQRGSDPVNAWELGVLGDGGSFVAPSNTDALYDRLVSLGLVASASLVNSCNGGKADALYNFVPSPVQALDRFVVTRASTKLRIGSDGLYGSVANNVPAFEFNTDGSYRGLLVEPGATNLALRSQEFGTSPWTAEATSSVSVNTQVAPDGATTADTYTQGATPGTARIQQAYTVSSGAQITQSIFVKKSVGTHIRFSLSDSATVTNGGGAWFNLDTGAVGTSGATGTGTFTSASISALPNGWYRLSLTVAVPATTGYLFLLYVASADNSGTRLANGEVFLWQAQAETGSVATSPIVTTAGTASRVADVVSLTGASSLIGQSAGTFYMEVEKPSYTTGAAAERLLSVSDGTNANRMLLQYTELAANKITAISITSSVQQVGITQADSQSGITRLAYTYSLNDFALYVGGVSKGTDVSGTVPATSRIDIGNYLGGTQPVLWIRSVTLFPTRLANATLASITA